MNDLPEKPKIEIEAPSAEQIRAAKKMRRNMAMPHTDEQPIQEKKSRRSLIEGIVLMLMGLALFGFLQSMGDLAWILALIPFLGGVIVMVKGMEK
jgi:hypothetical protein